MRNSTNKVKSTGARVERKVENAFISKKSSQYANLVKNVACKRVRVSVDKDGNSVFTPTGKNVTKTYTVLE